MRVRALTAWTRFDALLGDGSLRNIAATLATDSLGVKQMPFFTPSETEIRTASGLANFRLTAGQLVAVANSRVMTAPVILEYGLTRRLTLGVVVPLVESRTTVQSQLNPTVGLANVGPNPAFSPSAGAGVRTQNAALVTSLRQAADTLRGRVTTCQATPTNPICAPINGQQVAVQTLLQSTTTMAGALERLYGTSTATPGLPYIPIAKDASQTTINAQIAALQTAYQMFLAKNVVSGSVVPAAAPAANFQFQSLLTAVGHDTLRSVDRSSIGDISLGATFQVANTFGDSSAEAANGLHVRLAVNGTLRIGTGQPGNRNRFFDFGTGYGQPGLEGGVAGDVQINGRVSATAIGSYTLQLGTVDVDRVPNTGYLAYPLGAPIAGTFSAGNVLALTVIPRVRLSGYFALNGRYSVLHIGADQYTLGPLPADPLTAVLPTAPYGAAAATAQQVGIGFSYSTVLGPDANPGRLPFEVTYNHLETFAASGGPVAKTFRDQVELRVYFRR